MSFFTPEVISMIVGIVVALLIAVVPQLDAIKTELVTVVTVLVGLVIAGLGGERVMAARSSGATKVEREAAAQARTTSARSALDVKSL